MDHWPHCRCHLRFYRCTADDHYHTILGPENISWPFWSLEAAEKHILFAEMCLTQDARSPKEREWVKQEIAMMREKAKALDGPLRFLYHEQNVAEEWQKFFTGNSKSIGYETETGQLMPLYCDFVKRPISKPKGTLTSDEQTRRALSQAIPVTMLELGITLDLI